MSLRSALATPQGKSQYVRRLFHRIADRYDLITVLLSFGLDRRWKRRLAGLALPPRGGRVLDLASGTGDIALELSSRGARVVGLDVTFRMIELARAKRGSALGPEFLVGDMMALPFAAGSFDVVTTGYGLRNVPELEPALREILRVLRPGGHMVSLDFDRPRNPVVRIAFFAYLTVVGSVLGGILHRDPDTYRYIPESLRRYPGATNVAHLMTDLGFRNAGATPLIGGLMAFNHGRR